MFLCFETIKSIDGNLQNIEFHQKRFENTRKALFKQSDEISLREHISVPKQGTYRVKVEYNNKIQNVTCKEYEETRVFKKFLLCNADFEYAFKFCERECFCKPKHGADEILFLKNNLLSDTTIANIALMKDGVWFTPKKPLLKGTTRERLLEQGLLKEDNLGINDLKIAQKFAIMNALIGFKVLENIKIEEEN